MVKKFFAPLRLVNYLEELDGIVEAQKIEASSNGDNSLTLAVYDSIRNEDLNYIREHFLALGYGVFFTQAVALRPYHPKIVPMYMTLTWW